MNKLQTLLEKHELDEVVVWEALLDYLSHTDNHELYYDVWEVLHGTVFNHRR